MKNIYLIRHTESEKNLSLEFGSLHKNFKLTKNGINDAKQIGQSIIKKLEYKNLELYSSKSLRTIETANIIGKIIGIQPHKANFYSVNSGNFGGKSMEEQSRLFSEFNEIEKKYCMGEECGFNLHYPNGESIIDFQKRIIKTFESIILISKFKNIIFCCNQSVIGAILNRYIKNKKFNYDYIKSDLGHTSKITFSNNYFEVIYQNSSLLK